MPGVGIATRHGLVQVGLPRLLSRRSGGGGAGERPLRALINGTPRAGPGRQDRRATTPHPDNRVRNRRGKGISRRKTAGLQMLSPTAAPGAVERGFSRLGHHRGLAARGVLLAVRYRVAARRRTPPHAAARSAGTGHWLRRLPQQDLGRFWRVVVRPVGGRELMVGADRKAARAGLHMGEEGLRGANTVFRWDFADLSESSRPGDALPCAHRGVCAHGSASAYPDGHSKTAESRGRLAFVPASPSSPMCNPLLRPGRRTHCRRRHPTPTTSTTGPKVRPRQGQQGPLGSLPALRARATSAAWLASKRRPRVPPWDGWGGGPHAAERPPAP